MNADCKKKVNVTIANSPLAQGLEIMSKMVMMIMMKTNSK